MEIDFKMTAAQRIDSIFRETQTHIADFINFSTQRLSHSHQTYSTSAQSSRNSELSSDPSVTRLLFKIPFDFNETSGSTNAGLALETIVEG